MIKELINDLVNSKITLSGALTKAKVIAFKINNSQFKSWINNEVTGYEDYETLPSYRIFSCDLKAYIEDNHGKRAIVIDAHQYPEKHKQLLYNHYTTDSIDGIEKAIQLTNASNGGILIKQFPAGLTKLIFDNSNAGRNVVVQRAGQEISISKFENILNLTKQKLLDTLLELDELFPNLTNEYSNTQENSYKVQQIITNNIYGGASPINISAGDNNSQEAHVHGVN
jgi:hypothetical protein